MEEKDENSFITLSDRGFSCIRSLRDRLIEEYDLHTGVFFTS
jgi:hypothetical protein